MNNFFTLDIETIDALQHFTKEGKEEFNNGKHILVEGDSDVDTLNIFLEDKKITDVKVIVPRDLDGNGTDGKNEVLKKFNQYKDKMENLVCLIDRDLDPILGRDYELNSRIYEYDYYELENYLFEDRVLDTCLRTFYSKSLSEVDNLDGKINLMESFFNPIATFAIIRELDYRAIKENIISCENEKKKVLTFAQLSYLNKDYNLEKAKSTSEVFKILHELIDNNFKEFNKSYNDYVTVVAEFLEEIEVENNNLYMLRYLTKGKHVAKCLHKFIEILFELKIIYGSKQNITNQLLEIWIPKISIQYNNLIDKILKNFPCDNKEEGFS